MVYLKDSNIHVESAADVAKVFQDLLALEDAVEQDKEHFYVMHLTVRNQVKMVELVNVGVLTYSPVHPRETYRRAVMAGSAAIIIMLFWALLASGQITLRRIDGWETLQVAPADEPLDFAA